MISVLNLLKGFDLRRIAFLPALAAACISLATFPAWHHYIGDAIVPYRQWLHAMPAVFVGVALGLLPADANRRRLSIGLIVLSLLPAVLAGLPGVSIAYGVGVSLVIIAISLMPPHDFPAFVQSLSSCTLGVYLVHMAALGAFYIPFGKGSYMAVLCAIVTSFLVVWAARRFVPVSRIVLG